MNIKSTLALVVLVACGLGAWFASGSLRHDVGLPPEAKPDAGPVSVLALSDAKDLRGVTIERDGKKLEFNKGADGVWRMPGNWPTKPAKVRDLVAAVGGLSSRFKAETPSDLAAYGLLAPAVTLTLQAEGKPVVLSLGEAAGDGRTAFERPTYLRVGESADVWRLGPGLVALLSRPADYYLQRRVFPSTRELKDEGGVGRVARIDARELKVEEKGELRFSLKKEPAGWELSYPVRDALDPAARDKVLEAAADFWAEKFVDAPKEFKAERTVTAVGTDGRAVVLDVGPDLPGGDVPPPFPMPGMPEPKVKKRAIARLRGFERYFEIDSSNFASLSPDMQSLRDSQLARFKSDDARELTLLTSKGKIVLRNVAKPKSAPEDPPPPADWKLVEPINASADSSAVEKVVSALSALNAVDRDAGQKAEAGAAVAAFGIEALGVGFLLGADRAAATLGTATPGATLTLKVSEGPDRAKKDRTVVVRLGRHDAAAKKLFATSGGWPRVNEVGDELAGLVLGKGALDFRGKKLLDGHSSALKSIAVTRLDLSALGGVGAGPLAAAALAAFDQSGSLKLERNVAGDWALVAPVKTLADQGRAADLASKLAGLDVVTWIADKAGPGEYGLGTPAIKATFTYEDAKKPARTLLVGGPRPEGGYFARMEDAPEVFAVSKELFDVVGRGSLAYRPEELWAFGPGDEVTEFTIRRAGMPEFKVIRKGDGWEVTGPFTVAAPPEIGGRLVKALSSPRAEKYLAHDAPPDAYGLAKPRLTLTVKIKSGKEHTLTLGDGRAARLDKGTAVFNVGDEVAKAADQSALDFLDRVLFKFDPAGVTSVVRTAGKETFEAAKKDDIWEITKPSAQPGDDRKLPDLFRHVAGLRAEKFVAYAPSDTKPFGLDAPTATITLKAPAEVVLLIGGEAPGGGRFAQVKGSPGIAVLADADVKKLLAGPLTFRDHLLAKLPDADEASLTAGERKAMFTKPEGTWKLAKPASADADHDALEGFLNNLARLRADEFVADAPDAAALKKYGLEKPAAAWSFGTAGKEGLWLAVGAEESGGVRRYARIAGKDLVFLLDAKLSAQAVAEYRPRTVFKKEIDPAQVEEVRFGYAEGAFTLKKVDGNWQFDGKPDVKVNAAAVTDALSALRGLKLDRYISDTGADLKLYGLDPVTLTLEVTTPDGKQTLLLGGEMGGGRRRYAKQPGKDTAVFVLGSADGFKLARTMKELTAK